MKLKFLISLILLSSSEAIKIHMHSLDEVDDLLEK